MVIEVVHPTNFLLAWVAFTTAAILYLSNSNLANWFSTIAIFNLLLSIIN